MKSIIFYHTIAAFLAAMFASGGAYGRGVERKVTVTAPEIVLAGDSVTVAFDASISRRTIKRGRTFVFRPVISDGVHSVSLPRIVVYGGLIAKTRNQRRAWSAGEEEVLKSLDTRRRNHPVSYKASVPAQYWMRGADVRIESAVWDCSRVTADKPDVLALSPLAHLIPELRDSIVTTTVAAEPPALIPRSVGDTLSRTFPFIVRDDGFNPQKQFDIYDDERESSLVVYFEKNSDIIDAEYLNNRQVLADLIDAVNSINRASNCEVARIVLGGFASPEGPLAINDGLARRRAEAIKAYVVERTGIAKGLITIYNGSADWRGLRKMTAASEMEYRDEVLDVIDNVPLWNPRTNGGRLGALKNLRGGKPYEYIRLNFLPLLRSGTFIKIYYENRAL